MGSFKHVAQIEFESYVEQGHARFVKSSKVLVRTWSLAIKLHDYTKSHERDSGIKTIVKHTDIHQYMLFAIFNAFILALTLTDIRIESSVVFNHSCFYPACLSAIIHIPLFVGSYTSSFISTNCSPLPIEIPKQKTNITAPLQQCKSSYLTSFPQK